MKTIQEWLNLLPEEYRDLAIENMKEQSSPATWETKRRSLDAALGSAFVWGDTKQGHIFWETLSDKLQ